MLVGNPLLELEGGSLLALAGKSLRRGGAAIGVVWAARGAAGVQRLVTAGAVAAVVGCAIVGSAEGAGVLPMPSATEYSSEFLISPFFNHNPRIASRSKGQSGTLSAWAQFFLSVADCRFATKNPRSQRTTCAHNRSGRPGLVMPGRRTLG